MNRTAHAGEARGAESVKETLERLNPQRIGHGVRSITDPHLLRQLANQKIHLEVCPACNIQIGRYDSFGAHPLRQLFEEGVSVGINTDTRTVTSTTLSADYSRIANAYGWTASEFKAINIAAAESAFCPSEVQTQLLDVLSSAQ